MWKWTKPPEHLNTRTTPKYSINALPNWNLWGDREKLVKMKEKEIYQLWTVSLIALADEQKYKLFVVIELVYIVQTALIYSDFLRMRLISWIALLVCIKQRLSAFNWNKRLTNWKEFRVVLQELFQVWKSWPKKASLPCIK